MALKRYYFEVESAAAIDKLTNLLNRIVFDFAFDCYSKIVCDIKLTWYFNVGFREL